MLVFRLLLSYLVSILFAKILKSANFHTCLLVMSLSNHRFRFLTSSFFHSPLSTYLLWPASLMSELTLNSTPSTLCKARGEETRLLSRAKTTSAKLTLNFQIIFLLPSYIFHLISIQNQKCYIIILINQPSVTTLFFHYPCTSSYRIDITSFDNWLWFCPYNLLNNSQNPLFLYFYLIHSK